MTVPVCSYTIVRESVVGDIRMKVVEFNFSKYATNGKAFDPALFGFIPGHYLYTMSQWTPKGLFDYNGSVLKVYTSTNTEFADNTDAGIVQLLMFGK